MFIIAFLALLVAQVSAEKAVELTSTAPSYLVYTAYVNSGCFFSDSYAAPISGGWAFNTCLADQEAGFGSMMYASPTIQSFNIVYNTLKFESKDCSGTAVSVKTTKSTSCTLSNGFYYTWKIVSSTNTPWAGLGNGVVNK